MLPIQTIILVCVCYILCITPLTMYLFWLAGLNRSQRPSVVEGRWDFVALLSGLMGFLLCGGFALSLATSSLNLITGEGFGQFWLIRTVHYLAWLVCTGGYLLLIFLASFLTLRKRKSSLSIYNVDLGEFEAALQHLLARLGCSASRFGNIWSDSQNRVEVVPFHALKHIQLRILTSDPRLREEIEREIRSSMSRSNAPDNPTGTWLSTVAVTGFVSVIVCVGLLFIAMLASR